MKHEVTAGVQWFNGPKKPNMPEGKDGHHVPSLKVLVEQNISQRRAHRLDFGLKSVVDDPSLPEFGGRNTQMSSEQGHSIKPASAVVYTPLIDMEGLVGIYTYFIFYRQSMRAYLVIVTPCLYKTMWVILNNVSINNKRNCP
jgi:hypothetical protein